MSVVEPKAPFARIRKSKVKKMSKDKDGIHLPVYVPHTRRYSSLTPSTTNPQNKRRECCRHFFENCFKIPGCKLVCLRCILPQCYRGNGSDEDEAVTHDKDYHNRNKRSTEISPTIEGATGGTEPLELELTEINYESVVLIPPPRGIVNDYRMEPCKTSTDSPTSEITRDRCNWDITYIELERVRQTPTENGSNNFLCSSLKSNSGRKSGSKKSIASAYEIPINSVRRESVKRDNSLKDFTVDYACVVFDPQIQSSKYNADFGLDSDDSETKHYINEDVLQKGCNESIRDTEEMTETVMTETVMTETVMTETESDVSFDETNQQKESKTELAKRFKQNVQCEKSKVDTTNVNNSYEYVNLKPNDSNETNGVCSNRNFVNILADPPHMKCCVGDNDLMAIIPLKNNQKDKDLGDQKSNDYVNEIQNIDATGKCRV